VLFLSSYSNQLLFLGNQTVTVSEDHLKSVERARLGYDADEPDAKVTRYIGDELFDRQVPKEKRRQLQALYLQVWAMEHARDAAAIEDTRDGVRKVLEKWPYVGRESRGEFFCQWALVSSLASRSDHELTFPLSLLPRPFSI